MGMAVTVKSMAVRMYATKDTQCFQGNWLFRWRQLRSPAIFTTKGGLAFRTPEFGLNIRLQFCNPTRKGLFANYAKIGSLRPLTAGNAAKVRKCISEAKFYISQTCDSGTNNFGFRILLNDGYLTVPMSLRFATSKFALITTPVVNGCGVHYARTSTRRFGLVA